MPDTVISIIKGGLGNQLFIYSAGLAFALRNDRDFYIDDRLGYTHDGYGRSYRLDRFSISAKAVPDSWRIAPSLKHPRHKAVRVINKLLPLDWRGYIAQRWDESSEQLTARDPYRHRITLNGYWQDEAYFRDFSNRIKCELAPPIPPDLRNRELGDKFASEETVFVHARRVRYPTLLDAEYYRAAVSGIREKISAPHFAVFSDDMEWARANIDFGESPVQWIEHNAEDELADLWLMTRCRNAIIANSSFSWWGAWLGASSDDVRLIFTPDHPNWAIRPAEGWHCIPTEE